MRYQRLSLISVESDISVYTASMLIFLQIVWFNLRCFILLCLLVLIFAPAKCTWCMNKHNNNNSNHNNNNNTVADTYANNITIFYHCIWSLSYFHSPQPYTHTSPTPSEFTSRHTKNNIIEFNNDIASSDLILHLPTSLTKLLNSYDSTLCSILDKHAPLITKLPKPRKPNPWYTPALLAVKSARRHLERKYISTPSVQDYKILCRATN